MAAVAVGVNKIVAIDGLPRPRSADELRAHIAAHVGDLNCVGAFSGRDIDPFFARLGGGVCP